MSDVMAHCLEHSRALVAGPHGALTCPFCGSAWMRADQVEVAAPGALSHLTVETREASGAFAKQRRCLECSAPLTPMRIGRTDGWVERCSLCDCYWVERIDLRTLLMLSKSVARQRAFETLAPSDQRELSTGIAELAATAFVPELSLGQAILAALGVPMLERVEGNRVPWMTWTLTVVLVAVFVAGSLWPETCGPMELAWTGQSGAARLFWANLMHFDVFHLVGNVAFLLAFGDAVEQRLPRARLLVAFVVLGPLTVLIQALLTPSAVAIGGASGAVAILMGAAVFLQPRARIIMVLLRRLPVRVPMALFGGFAVAYQAAMALLGVPGVGWYAHLSGLALGVGVASLGTGRRSREAACRF